MADKTALITGFSRGLGRSMALHLAGNGVDVIGTYRGNEDAANDVVAQIEAAGAKGVALQLDVHDVASFPAFRDQVSEALSGTFGRERLDALVNNAGSGINAPYAETTEEQLDAMLAEHVKAPFLLTQALLPLLSDGSRVLNLSTGLARFSLAGFSAYASAKGANEVLTRYMALELGERGIRVNVIAPGAIATDFGGGAVRDNAGMNEHIASVTALGRVGEADDIGSAVAAILSDDFSWASGTRIELSGGQSL